MGNNMTRREVLALGAGVVLAPSVLASVATEKQAPVTGRAYSAAEAKSRYVADVCRRQAILRRYKHFQLVQNWPPELHSELAALLHAQEECDRRHVGKRDDVEVGVMTRHHFDLIDRSFSADSPFRLFANHWPIVGQAGHIYWENEGDELVGHDDVEPQEVDLRIVWTHADCNEFLLLPDNEEFMNIIAEEVRLKILFWVAKFMKGHVAVVHGVKPRMLKDGIIYVRREVRRLTGRTPDVMQINRDHAAILGLEPGGLFPLAHTVSWENMRVVVNALVGEVLMGYRGVGAFTGDFGMATGVPFLAKQTIKSGGTDAWRYGYSQGHALVLRGDRRPSVGIVNMIA